MNRIAIAYFKLLKYFGFAILLGILSIFYVPPYYPNFNFVVGFTLGLHLCCKFFVRDWKAFVKESRDFWQYFNESVDALFEDRQ